MIVGRIKQQAVPGLEIPKPEAREKFLVKGWGQRRGEEALIYFVPNRKNPSKPYQKGITISDFETAYGELTKSGELTRKWFNDRLPECAKEGSCNFTTIGGIFEVLEEARYVERGTYRR